jgi:hypothetical protein
MYFYVEDTAKQDMKVKVLASFKERAERIYQENLLAYVKAVLRRSFAKPIVSSARLRNNRARSRAEMLYR